MIACRGHVCGGCFVVGYWGCFPGGGACHYSTILRWHYSAVVVIFFDLEPRVRSTIFTEKGCSPSCGVVGWGLSFFPRTHSDRHIS